LSFDILGACEGLANKLAGMDRPTKQSLYNKSILDFVRACVCSLVYTFPVCWPSTP